MSNDQAPCQTEYRLASLQSKLNLSLALFARTQALADQLAREKRAHVDQISDQLEEISRLHQEVQLRDLEVVRQHREVLLRDAETAQQAQKVARLHEEVARLHEEVARLHEEVKLRDAEVLRLHREVLGQNVEVGRMAEEIARLHKEIKLRDEEVERQIQAIANLQNEVVTRETQIVDTNNSYAALETAYQSLLHSASWRVTAPMRLFSSRIKGLLRLRHDR